MVSGKPQNRGSQSLVRRIFLGRSASVAQRDDDVVTGTRRSTTIVELLSEIVGCPEKTENAVRLLKVVLSYFAVFLLLFLAILVTLSHWRQTLHIDFDHAVPLWAAGLSVSATSVVVTTILSRIIRRRSAQEQKRKAEN